jgi:hypothetical protein
VTLNTSTNERHVLPEKLARQVQSQFTQFTHTDMSAFTLDRAKSDFYGAKTDLTVYNTEGKLVLNGRDFGDRTFFWQP